MQHLIANFTEIFIRHYSSMIIRIEIDGFNPVSGCRQGKNRQSLIGNVCKGGVLLTKKKIMELVLVAASVLLAVVKSIIEQEKSQEDTDETS